MNGKALLVVGAGVAGAALLSHKKRELPACKSITQVAANAGLKAAGLADKMTCDPSKPLVESSSGIVDQVKCGAAALFGGALGAATCEAKDVVDEAKHLAAMVAIGAGLAIGLVLVLAVRR